MLVPTNSTWGCDVGSCNLQPFGAKKTKSTNPGNRKANGLILVPLIYKINELIVGIRNSLFYLVSTKQFYDFNIF